MPQAALQQAVDLLLKPGDRVVLGGSDDGGYYLIGVKQLHPRLFAQIEWSTERVLQQTLQAAREIGLHCELLPTWYDVDDAATLERLQRELASGGAGSGSAGFDARHTRAFLEQLQVATEEPSLPASQAC